MEEREFEALDLIDKAEDLVDAGEGEEGINLFEKAAQIYLDHGSYMKLDELYTRIAEVISQFKNKIQAIYRLKAIIRKTEELKLEEVSGRLLIQLGNFSFKIQDWETAGESYQKASEYFSKADPEEFHNLSSLLLLKAGQTLERSNITKDTGKRLIFKAVMKINKFDELFRVEEKRAASLIAMEEFEPAANKFYDIAKNFRKALDNLEDILNEEESSEDTIYNAKARFIHFVAEYQTVSALCLNASGKEKYLGRIKELGLDSLELYKQSISLLKKYLFTKKFDFDVEVILRICFDTMLIAIVQRMLEVREVNPIEYLLENIENNKALVEKLKETPYFKIAERIEKVGLSESLSELQKVNLGHFEKIKNTLISKFL